MGLPAGYSSHKKIPVTNGNLSVYTTNYPVFVTIHSGSGADAGGTGEATVYLNGLCKHFPQDIIFLANDDTTEMDFWILDKSADPCIAMVEVSDSLASGQSPTINMYYGNSSKTTSDSSFTNTVVVGGDFSGNAALDGEYGVDAGTNAGQADVIAPFAHCFRSRFQAVHYDAGTYDRTYFVWNDMTNFRIDYYDHDTGTFSTNQYGVLLSATAVGTADIHHNPTIHVIENGTYAGYILCALPFSDGSLKTVRSSSAEDISSFDALRTIVAASGADAFYPEILELDNTNLYVCYLQSSGWHFSEYDDTSAQSYSGDSWASPITVIQFDNGVPEPFYGTACTDGTAVHICGNEGLAYENVYYAVNTGATGPMHEDDWEEADGTSISCEYGVSTIAKADMEKPVTRFGVFMNDCHVIDGKFCCVYTDCDSTSGWNAGTAYHLIYDSGWTETNVPCVITGYVSGDIYGAYNTGICLDPNDSDIVYVGDKQAGTTSDIQEWTLSGGTFSKTDDITSGCLYYAGRPYCVKNYHADFKLVWDAVVFQSANNVYFSSKCGSIAKHDCLLLKGNSTACVLDGTTSFTDNVAVGGFSFQRSHVKYSGWQPAGMWHDSSIYDSAIIYGSGLDNDVKCRTGESAGGQTWETDSVDAWDDYMWTRWELRKTGTGAGQAIDYLKNGSSIADCSDANDISGETMALRLCSAAAANQDTYVDWQYLRKCEATPPTIGTPIQGVGRRVLISHH